MSLSQPTQNWFRHYRWQLIIAVIVLIVAIASAVTYITIANSNPQLPPVQGIDCGYISSHGFGPARNQTGTVRQVGNCFWQAYQQCRTATLQVTDMGVDAGATQMLVVTKQQNGCVVVDSSQNYNVNFGGSHFPVTTSTCSKLQLKGAALLFSGCKAADDANQVSDSFSVSLETDCGYVQNGMSANIEKVAENCFVQSAQHCYAATMHYIPDATNTQHTHAFSIAEAACTITDTTVDQQTGQTLATYTCASVAPQQDGLHLTTCGKDGTIIVPAPTTK